MAISYIDHLANELIDAGIATNIKQIQNWQWEGNIDVSRQEINFVQKIWCKLATIINLKNVIHLLELKSY